MHPHLKPVAFLKKAFRFLVSPGSGDSLRFVAQRPRILRMLSGGGDTALDLGCGSGFYGKEIAKNHRLTVLADIDTNNLLVQTSINPGASRVCLDLPHLPFKAQYFDTIFLIEVLEHIKNDEAVITEIGRILKKKGTLIMSVPHPPMIIGVRLDTDANGLGHKRVGYTRSEIASILSRNGFEILRSRYCLFYPARLSMAMVTLFKKLLDIRPVNFLLMPLWILDLFLPNSALLKPSDLIIKAVKT
jgi:SAM-dependent methyltransferase